MISYCESLLPWHLSFRLRAVIDYLQCDMLHLCFIKKEKVSLVPVPISCSEQYSQLFKDRNYYKHPNLYLESMNLLPHHISEVDKFLLRAEKDRVWGNKLSGTVKLTYSD